MTTFFTTWKDAISIWGDSYLEMMKKLVSIWIEKMVTSDFDFVYIKILNKKAFIKMERLNVMTLSGKNLDV